MDECRLCSSFRNVSIIIMYFPIWSTKCDLFLFAIYLFLCTHFFWFSFTFYQQFPPQIELKLLVSLIYDSYIKLPIFRKMSHVSWMRRYSVGPNVGSPPIVGWMLVQRLRRWPNINPTLDRRSMYTGQLKRQIKFAVRKWALSANLIFFTKSTTVCVLGYSAQV